MGAVASILMAGGVIATVHSFTSSSSSSGTSQAFTEAAPLDVPRPSGPIAPGTAIPGAVAVTDLPDSRAATKDPGAGAMAPTHSGTEHGTQAVPSGNSKAPAAATEAYLEGQLRIVDEARASFVEKRSAVTLDRVAAYRQKFPGGRFSAEIDALEIQALAALGRSAEAETKATRFLAKHPGSPYTQRVRTAVQSKN